MSVKSTKRKALGTTLVLGIAFAAALTTVASAASRHHHKARDHMLNQARGSYASAPHQAAPFANDPTMYAIQHHIPVPDKTSPGIDPTSPAR